MIEKCGDSLWWWCSPCDTHHRVVLPRWTWNGDLEKPTISPSVLVTYGDGRRCHLFVREGMVQYLSDCTHEMAGQTVPIEPPLT